jgi:hypothetical protein
MIFHQLKMRHGKFNQKRETPSQTEVYLQTLPDG